MKHKFFQRENLYTKNVNRFTFRKVEGAIYGVGSISNYIRYIYAGIFIFGLIGISTLFTSCNKEVWDDHYSQSPSIKSDLNIYDYIASRSELSTFKEMLDITGYDSILSKSQTFTVWAPENASLAAVDMNDFNAVLKIVTNHITRFSHPTAEIIRKSKDFILMDNKILRFEKVNDKFVYGDKEILEPDIATANGIVHIMGDYVPYRRNFWEFINEQEGLDSLRNYLNSLTVQTFDEEKSFEDGIFVDSVFKETNVVLDYLADLKSEDSTYTAILPDNNAWNEAFATNKPYFNTLPKYGGEVTQNANAKLMIVLDLFFRGRLEIPIVNDTLTSTYETKFSNPGRLFEGATLTKLSNGYAYITSQLKSKITESWLKPIKVEAETERYRTSANYTLNTMTSIGTGYNISRGYYLFGNPSTTSDLTSINNMFVKFGIPYTYSGKYNIYCVVVPAMIISPTDTKANKIRFFLTHLNSDGVQLNDQPIGVNNNVIYSTSSETQKITQANMFISNSSKIDTMLVVKDYQFLYADRYSDPVSGYTPSVYLRVNNAARLAEALTYTRLLRIDCLILEPVVE